MADSETIINTSSQFGPAIFGALGTLIGAVITALAGGVVVILRARGDVRRADNALVFDQQQQIIASLRKDHEELKADLHGLSKRHDERINTIEKDHADQMMVLREDHAVCLAENKKLRARVSTLEDRVAILRRQAGDGDSVQRPAPPSDDSE